MSAVEQTLNVTVAQVEGALLKGQTVPDFAREWAEPPANVLAIFRRLQREGRIPQNGPAQVATTRPLTSVPTTTAAASAPSGLTVDALVNAAARSTSKRTQAIGVRLADLADVLRKRLTEERVEAERKARERVEREAARAEVERLTQQLADAYAKAGVKPPAGNRAPRTPAQIESARRNLALRNNPNTEPCAKGCGVVPKTKAGKSAHERHCKAAS